VFFLTFAWSCFSLNVKDQRIVNSHFRPKINLMGANIRKWRNVEIRRESSIGHRNH